MVYFHPNGVFFVASLGEFVQWWFEIRNFLKSQLCSPWCDCSVEIWLQTSTQDRPLHLHNNHHNNSVHRSYHVWSHYARSHPSTNSSFRFLRLCRDDAIMEQCYHVSLNIKLSWKIFPLKSWSWIQFSRNWYNLINQLHSAILNTFCVLCTYKIFILFKNVIVLPWEHLIFF